MIKLLVVVDEGREKTLKTGYMTLYTKLFMVTGPIYLKYGVCDFPNGTHNKTLKSHKKRGLR